MSPKRPINADVPAPEDKEPDKAPAPKEKPPRQPKSQTPKLLGALVLLALVFIVAAIVGSTGGGGPDEGGSSQGGRSSAQAPPDEAEAPAPTAEGLPFPSLATNNTTRIGGPDPAANAAGAALAVFPSTTPSQRPAAVTLVDEDDPRAIAAAVLMAPPIRAPILFKQDGELPEDSAEALEAMAPTGSDATDGAGLLSIGATDREDFPEIDKVQIVLGARPTPYGSASAIARVREEAAGPPKHFVIAPVDAPEFAAPAAAWAARSGDPVLFTEAKSLPPETAGVLQGHPKVPVYVLGPEAVIDKGVFKEISKISKRVKRVAGKDPVANAIAFARYRDGSFGWNVNDPGHGFVLARSDSPADAVGAAPLSASGTWGPLLLTDDAATLPAALRSYLLDVKPGYTTDPTRAFYNHVWLIGDQEAISVSQQAEVNELAELAKIGGGE
ncbi:MAG TPA: cell wall-binding repeat-containing protein [Solirubrobacterales bacterium]|nr:cell wall-binding repeat-containing protein [Solirubrobacterales bacterium]